MRRYLVAIFFVFAGCVAAQTTANPPNSPPAGPPPGPWTPVPPPPPQPPQPPPAPPPQPPPTAPPSSVGEVLAKIVVGRPLSEATAAVGAAPTIVPASSAGPATARWLLALSAGKWMVFATLDSGNVVTGKNAARVESNP